MNGTELYDLSWVLILFRTDIHFELISSICAVLCELLSCADKAELTENSVRKSLAPIIDHAQLDENTQAKWAFVNHENLSFNRRTYKDASTICAFIFEHIGRLIASGAHAQAYDFVDAIHCLPEIIAERQAIPAAYIKTYITPYAKKWNDKAAMEIRPHTKLG